MKTENAIKKLENAGFKVIGNNILIEGKKGKNKISFTNLYGKTQYIFADIGDECVICDGIGQALKKVGEK